MLKIKLIMNSSVEDVFAFKTCCGFKAGDQNLEIQIRNVGEQPVVVISEVDLVGKKGVQRIQTLMPHGHHALAPGQIMAFYCTMDETLWSESSELIVLDDQGNRYPSPILPSGDSAT